MRSPFITLAIESHRGKPMVQKDVEKAFAVADQRLSHNFSKVTGIYTHGSKKELDKIVNPLDDFGQALQKVQIPAQIGCVSVTFEQCNEEVNVVLHLHRRCVALKKRTFNLY